MNKEEVVKNFMENTENKRVSLYEEYLHKAVELMERSVEQCGFWNTGVQELILKDLLNRMDGIAIRTFIKELQSYEIRDGVERQKKYQQFISEHCQTVEGREKLFQKYPILHSCLQQTIDRCVGFYKEILIRLEQDKRKIEQELLAGKEIHGILDFGKENADAHFAGKRVLVIKLDCGESIVYKPHGIENEQWFDRFVQWLGENCGVDLYVSKRVLADGYGWGEYITYDECKNDEEAKRYFARIGMLMFASYLLGTHDIHCENLIAHGEYPVVVDLENLMIAEKKYKRDGQSEIQKYLQQSVLMLGILPYYHWNKDGRGVDLSALTGGENERLPFRIPVVKNADNSEIKIEFEHPVVHTKKNKACMNGVKIEVRVYEKEIVYAFEKAYQYVSGHQGVVTEKLKEVAEYRGRYLVADTQKYAMLLQASYHSSVMQKEGDRESLLRYSLSKNRKDISTADKVIMDAEIDALLNHDIPYFYFHMNETNLYSADGGCIPNFLERTPIESCIQKMKRFHQKDMEQQVRWIYMTLDPGRKEKVDLCTKEIIAAIKRPDCISKEKLLVLSEQIADKLLREAAYDQKYDTYHWFRFMVFGEKYGAISVTEADMYLYDGIAGISLFFHMLFALKRENEIYQKVCKALDKQMFDYTNWLGENSDAVLGKQSGMYHGEGSFVYTYLQIYKLNGKEKYLNYAKKHGECLWKVVQLDQTNDLLEGRAGAIVAFSLTYQACGDEKYLLYAKKTAEMLLKAAVEMGAGIGWLYSEELPPLLGMAHGNAGVIVAFALFKKITRTMEYDGVLLKMLEYENAGFNSATGDWYDYRAGKTKAEVVVLPEPVAWCHGAGGILISRILLMEALKGKEDNTELSNELRNICRVDIKRAASYLKKHKERDDFCLCHGMCGNLLIQKIYEETVGERANNKQVEIEDSLERKGVKWKEWYQPGFMNGYVGIGWYLLQNYLSQK